MFLLDTNVVSELRKSRTKTIDANVERWWSNLPLLSFAISIVTLLELEEGVLRMERRDPPQGRALRDWLEHFVVVSFADRVLLVTPTVARACAALQVPNKRQLGDALIAATALVHGLKIVTRNEADFVGAGIDVINPWLRAPDDGPSPSVRAFPPARIVCLTEETVETLYLLGEEHRIVGVTGYAVRPPRVRREKPRVGAFVSADVPKILALEPDLVLTFSDIQADIAAALIRDGVAVHAFNQRSVAGILAMIRTLGALVGAADRAEALAAGYERRLAEIAASAPAHRPRVYVEEWDEPLIGGIGWVSELVEIAGGLDVFPELRHRQAANDRIVAAADVIAAAPDVIVASWCGKKVVPAAIAARPGWDAIPAVGHGRIVEIKAPLILQPGPAALTDGLDALMAALRGPR